MDKAVSFASGRIVDDTVEHIIVEYDLVDTTGKIVGVERQKYVFDSIVWEHKCNEDCEDHS